MAAPIHHRGAIHARPLPVVVREGATDRRGDFCRDHLAILAAIAVGFATDEEALPPRTASLREGICAIHRSDAAHAAVSTRRSHSKGDQQCRAS